MLGILLLHTRGRDARGPRGGYVYQPPLTFITVPVM
jgi:hypothetical protein